MIFEKINNKNTKENHSERPWQEITTKTNQGKNSLYNYIYDKDLNHDKKKFIDLISLYTVEKASAVLRVGALQSGDAYC